MYPRNGSKPQVAEMEPSYQGPYIASDVTRARKLIEQITGFECSYAALTALRSRAPDQGLREALEAIDQHVSHGKLGDWSIALNEIRKIARRALNGEAPDAQS
jgi:hypothetical protein